MAGKSADARFQSILSEYSEKYDIDSLSSPNDKANLYALIRNTMVIEEYQNQMYDNAVNGKEISGQDSKRVNDSLRDLTELNLAVEKQLNIDRKTRKTQQEQNFADYLVKLKQAAREFLEDEDRILKVWCKKCQIMVGRISGVYDTTEYEARFQCPQCKKNITVHRKERDVFFDVKNADWRRKYPIEIEQAKRLQEAPDIADVEDDLILGNAIEFSEEEGE